MSWMVAEIKTKAITAYLREELTNFKIDSSNLAGKIGAFLTGMTNIGWVARLWIVRLTFPLDRLNVDKCNGCKNRTYSFSYEVMHNRCYTQKTQQPACIYHSRSLWRNQSRVLVMFTKINRQKSLSLCVVAKIPAEIMRNYVVLATTCSHNFKELCSTWKVAS